MEPSKHRPHTLDNAVLNTLVDQRRDDRDNNTGATARSSVCDCEPKQREYVPHRRWFLMSGDANVSVTDAEGVHRVDRRLHWSWAPTSGSTVYCPPFVMRHLIRGRFGPVALSLAFSNTVVSTGRINVGRGCDRPPPLPCCSAESPRRAEFVESRVSRNLAAHTEESMRSLVPRLACLRATGLAFVTSTGAPCTARLRTPNPTRRHSRVRPNAGRYP